MSTTTNHSPHGYRNVLALLWLAAAALLAVTWLHVHTLSLDSRERELDNARRDLANLTRLSQEHAGRTLRSADQVIRFIQARYLEVGDRLDLVALSRQGVIDTEIFNQVGIIDSQGIYALANRPITGRIDLSDREHFKVHAEKNSGELFISKPVIGRATGKWSMQLTRRLSRPDGSFAGVVVLSIDPGYFTRFYGELNLGPRGLMALYGRDGIARARRVGEQDDFGSDATRSTLFEKGSVGMAASGTYAQKSVVDGIYRIFWYRQIPGYSLVTVAGVDEKYLLASHQEATRALYLQAAMVSALILALAGGISRHLWLLRREADAKRMAQLQIQERKEQLNAVFELSPDGFVSFDGRRAINFINPAFRHMMAQEKLNLIGIDESDFSAWLASLCEPAAAFMGLDNLRLLAGNNPEDGLQTIEIAGPNRRILKVQLRIRDTSTVSQILYFRDVTHETEVESLKSEFLAAAAHELRTPMASIYGFSEVLLNQATDPQSQREFLEIIHKQSRLMVDILNELLDLARIEARKGKDFIYVTLSAQELLRDIAKAFKLPPGRQAPVLDLPQQTVYVLADSGKLRQAIVNVLSNAYKYSPDGGAIVIRVEVSDEPAGGPWAFIHITDHGIGMTPEQAGKVFTRFYRADNSGKVPGTGLGMSLAKEIVEHHRGSMSLVSAPGEGTQVSLRLPLQAAPPPANSA